MVSVRSGLWHAQPELVPSPPPTNATAGHTYGVMKREGGELHRSPYLG